MRPQPRTPRVIRLGSPEREDDLFHALELSRLRYPVYFTRDRYGFR